MPLADGSDSSIMETGDENVENLDESTVTEGFETPNGLKKVKNIIAVSSCKGGVGKSTVSVNLAYTLHQAGNKVGILDADIYGPSLPTMTGTVGNEVVFADNRLLPMQYAGVKLMSMGFLSSGPAIIRGPMVNQILNQLITLTDWEELDYLVIDMPPGTGDIQLTLAQTLDISAAVIVTTPQRLSFVDVAKGIDMFDTVNIPTVAIVENMAEFPTYNFSNDFYDTLADGLCTAATSVDPDSNLRDKLRLILRESIESRLAPVRVFGSGHTQRLRDMWGIENLISLPLAPDVSESGDVGRPHVLREPDSILANKMSDLASSVIEEINSASDKPDVVEYDSTLNTVKFSGGDVPAAAIRKSCKCALCVEEMTGRPLLNPASVASDIRPLRMAPIGRYAMSFDWSDGHKSLIPFRQLEDLRE